MISTVKISIIIPCYNAQPYIEKCLRSCTEQDIPYSQYEIIVVNDGSKDNSLEIIKQVALEYPNIRILSQKNAGLSAARNKGFSLAIGDYVWFIDSDDWIKANSLKIITAFLSKKDIDGLVICAANIVNGNAIRRQDYSKIHNNHYSGLELFKKGYMDVCVPFTIYRRAFLLENSLRFMDGIFHEDSEFSPRAYFYAKRIAILNEVIYYVNMNPFSITRTVNPKKAFDYIKVAKSLSEFSQIVPSESKYRYNDFISMIINNSLFNSYKMDIDSIHKLNFNFYLNRYIFKHLKQSSLTKYRFEGILFHLCPRHCVQIYKFIQCMNRGNYKGIFGGIIYFFNLLK